jgi:hypothetical protein
MIFEVTHGCLNKVLVPATYEEDIYLNPAWCAHCGVKFFPRAPGGPTDEERERARKKREKFDEAMASTAATLNNQRSKP